MAKFKKYQSGTDYNLAINLNDYLPADHLCKQIEQIIGDLDTSTIEATYSNLGQGGLHPKLMLGIIFYGYAVGIRSGRKLAQACQEQLPFIYLSRNYRPQKSSINDFRKNHYAHFSDLFTQVLKKCAALGLIDSSVSIVDGSKMEANSARRRTKDKATHEKCLQTLLEDIASLEEELSKADTEEKTEVQIKAIKKK